MPTSKPGEPPTYTSVLSPAVGQCPPFGGLGPLLAPGHLPTECPSLLLSLRWVLSGQPSLLSPHRCGVSEPRCLHLVIDSHPVGQRQLLRVPSLATGTGRAGLQLCREPGSACSARGLKYGTCSEKGTRPGQHNCVLVVPAIQEAEAGELLEPRDSKPAWTA